MSDFDKGGRRWAPRIGVLLALAVGAAVASYFLFFQKEGNVSNAKAPFVAQQPAPPPKPPAAETFKWPIYGFTPQRTRYLDTNLAPPFTKRWVFGKGALIEFQPVLANGWLYLVDN